MADRVFQVRREFSEGPAERTVEKDRVISEPVMPLLLLSDDSSDLPAACLEHPPSLRQDEPADELRPAPGTGHALHQPQHLADVLLVGGTGVGKAGRKDSRCAVERIHFETGVLGQSQMIAQETIGQAFMTGVLQEGLSLFLDLARSPDVAEGQQLEGKTF